METSFNFGGPVPLRLALLVISVIGVAFFSSAEASLLSINKFRVRHLASQGNKGAMAASRVLANHERFFAAILLTENALIILASSVGTTLALTFFGQRTATIFIATLAMTAFVVIFGEITPKTLAAQFAERWALIIARPIEIVISAETAILYFFTFLPRLISRVLGEHGLIKVPSITEGEIRMLVDMAEKEGAVQEKEADLVENVFRFGDRKTWDVMTPRTEVPWVRDGMLPKEFVAHYHRHPQGRYPVYKGTPDNVTGVLASREVFRAMATGQLGETTPVTTLARPPFFVPEQKLLSELLDEMRKAGVQMAIAVDEFGGCAGTVTLIQVLEALVGPLSAEESDEVESVQTLTGGVQEIAGDLRVDEANERLGINLPLGDYVTVAGLLLERIGHIPREGEEVQVTGVVLRVARMRGRQILRIQVHRLTADEEAASESAG